MGNIGDLIHQKKGQIRFHLEESLLKQTNIAKKLRVSTITITRIKKNRPDGKGLKTP